MLHPRLWNYSFVFLNSSFIEQEAYFLEESDKYQTTKYMFIFQIKLEF